MVNWGDVPTWVTAGVALVALIGAWLAYSAQSQAVEKQAEQVELQRKQLEDQRSATDGQLEAIRLQARVIADQNRLQERQQADQVDVSARYFDGAQAKVLPDDNGEPVHIVLVFNGSKRPIRQVTAKVVAIRVGSRRSGARAGNHCVSAGLCRAG